MKDSTQETLHPPPHPPTHLATDSHTHLSVYGKPCPASLCSRSPAKNLGT